MRAWIPTLIAYTVMAVCTVQVHWYLLAQEARFGDKVEIVSYGPPAVSLVHNDGNQ
jgi:hypothetical protein